MAKVLSCSACAKRFFKENVCSNCGMTIDNAVLLTEKERKEVRRKYDSIVAASKIDPTYNQERFEEDSKWLFG